MDYRSRSRPRDYSPRERDHYFTPTFDRNHRSRSLDYRRDWSDEEEYERDRERERVRSSQPHLGRPEYYREREMDSPRRESPRRENKDFFQTVRRGDARDGRRDVARSQEWYPSPREAYRERERWQPPSPNELRQKWRGPPVGRDRGEYARGPPQQLTRHAPNLSPGSQTSAPRPLKITTTARPQPQQGKGFFGQRREPPPDESPRSIGYPPPRDSYREAPRDPRYRYDGRGMELQPVQGGPRDFIGASQGAAGGGYSRSYQHQSYHQSHQSAGGHQGGFSSGASGRRAVTMQPGATAGASSWKYQSGGGPQRYHRVHCGCFSFTWPPWSVEPAPPPQPRYPNIP